MKTSPLFLCAIATLAFSSCSDTSIRVDAGPVAGFSGAAYETYEWVPLDRSTREGLSGEEKALRAAFVDEVDKILTKRGLTKVGQGQSDLIVYARGLRAAGVTAIGQTPAGSGHSYPTYYQPDNASAEWLGAGSYLTENTQTSARFLISEPKTDKVVWRGEGVVTMNDKRSQILAQQDARKLARELLDGFPQQ